MTPCAFRVRAAQIETRKGLWAGRASSSTSARAMAAAARAMAAAARAVASASARCGIGADLQTARPPLRVKGGCELPARGSFRVLFTRGRQGSHAFRQRRPASHWQFQWPRTGSDRLLQTVPPPPPPSPRRARVPQQRQWALPPAWALIARRGCARLPVAADATLKGARLQPQSLPGQVFLFFKALQPRCHWLAIQVAGAEKLQGACGFVARGACSRPWWASRTEQRGAGRQWHGATAAARSQRLACMRMGADAVSFAIN